MRGCRVRAIWILKQNSHVFFSRRFATVERQWQRDCKQQGDGNAHNLHTSYCALPSDSRMAELIAQRKARDGSVEASAIREVWSVEGTDAWVDDPITRYVVSIELKAEVGTQAALLWPLILHSKGQYQILVLPLVEPHHLATYEELLWRNDGGGGGNGLSSMLLDLPCITGAFAVAHAIGDVVTGDVAEPGMFINPGPTLLDSLTGGIGIAAGIASRAKPVAAPVAAAATAVAAAAGQATSVITGAHGKHVTKSANKDAVRNFISSAMPFGTPLDLNVINLNAIRANGFSGVDVPPSELKQPAWKPYLFRGKQKMVFTVHEVITAALYDRDDVADVISVQGQVLCRADLEGLPDVTIQISCPRLVAGALTFHPCAQAPEQGPGTHRVTFSPPLGNFVLARYQALPGTLKLPLQGFYQLSMVSDDEGAFLIRMKVMEGYKSHMVMEYCTLTLPFPRRKIVNVDGTPSAGTFVTTEHLIEWRVAASSRSIFSKSAEEVTFSGTIKFAPQFGTGTSSTCNRYALYPEEEAQVDVKELEKTGDYYDSNAKSSLVAVEWEEAFTWDAYSYARASLKLVGATMSGFSIDPKAVSVYPITKAPIECFSQVVSGDYIFWNSLGRYPHSSGTAQ